MNPHKIGIYVEASNLKIKRDFEFANTVAHIQGMYFVEALISTVGNMFAGKNSKPHEYPDKPYDLGNTGELSEEEIQVQRDLIVARFMAMQTNFELNKKAKGQ